LFFLEDVVAPEHYDRLPSVREQSPVPIAVGEQLSSLTDAARFVQDHAVDLLRVHVSTVGGLSACRKLVALCELNGVQTAWHGPGDVSPVGMAANIALDVTTSAFGIQEGHAYDERVREVFPGTPVAVGGYLYPSDAPGWGVDLDEGLAARYPPETGLHERWAARVRRPDGGLESP
jgi:mannonate dehydratase